MTQQQHNGLINTILTHRCTTIPFHSEYFIIIKGSCRGRILKSNFQGRAGCLTILFHCHRQKMPEAPAGREKRLAAGDARVSGSFGDFYANPNPNIRRRKRQRIHGIVTGACGPQNYTVQFDCSQTLECFSNTLCLESSVASLPSPDLHHAISQVEGENTAPIERATTVIDANEVAANDIEGEEHLPVVPEDDEDENPEVEEEGASEDGEEVPVAEMGVNEEGDEHSPVETVPDGKEVPAAEMGVDEEGNERRPVRTLQEAPVEDLATYGGRKQAAIHWI